MGTTKQPGTELPDGEPLAVCINDCQLDYGQRRCELARVCFQVRCAFAEMRWGSVEAACNPEPLKVDENRLQSPHI
jgi:hypothetical protein